MDYLDDRLPQSHEIFSIFETFFLESRENGGGIDTPQKNAMFKLFKWRKYIAEFSVN